jgi:hypothetical protein
MTGMTADSERRATRDSWRAEPMPDARARVPIARAYDEAEYRRIARGLVPASPGDHWFIFLDGEWLAIHRRWTGHCLYRVRFAREGGCYRIAEAWANRDPAQFRRADDAADAEDIARLIEHLLLGRPYLVPE